MQDTILLSILFVYGVVDLLGLTGFLPARARRWITRNKSADTLDVLRGLGMNVDATRRANIARSIPKASLNDTPANWVQRELDRFTLKKAVLVGSTNRVTAGSFIDLMGATTNPRNAKAFASALAQHWREQVTTGAARQPQVDFVISSKRGSPLLGYEFAQRVELPFVLHNGDEKFESAGAPELASIFDFSEKPADGACALIVDDSTTGGEKVSRIISDLSRAGYVVSDCLVVFEPTVKNARSLLASKGVTLHSIVRI